MERKPSNNDSTSITKKRAIEQSQKRRANKKKPISTPRNEENSRRPRKGPSMKEDNRRDK